MKNAPKLLKVAIGLNIVGLIFLCFSLLTNSPLLLTLSFTIGVLCLLAGFIFWVFMVIQEAKIKGMLE